MARYKPEGRGFESRWYHLNFSLAQTFRPHYVHVVDAASNRNEYQEYFLGVKVNLVCRLLRNSGSLFLWKLLGLFRYSFTFCRFFSTFNLVESSDFLDTMLYLLISLNTAPFYLMWCGQLWQSFCLLSGYLKFNTKNEERISVHAVVCVI